GIVTLEIYCFKLHIVNRKMRTRLSHYEKWLKHHFLPFNRKHGRVNNLIPPPTHFSNMFMKEIPIFTNDWIFFKADSHDIVQHASFAIEALDRTPHRVRDGQDV